MHVTACLHVCLCPHLCMCIPVCVCFPVLLLKKIVLIYLFKLIYFQRERKGGREGEKHPFVVASPTPPRGDPACNPGLCPDGELNR